MYLETKDVIGPGKAFPTQKKCAEALGITQGAVARWEGVVPPLRVYQLRDILRKQRKVWRDLFGDS